MVEVEFVANHSKAGKQHCIILPVEIRDKIIKMKNPLKIKVEPVL